MQSEATTLRGKGGNKKIRQNPDISPLFPYGFSLGLQLSPLPFFPLCPGFHCII